MIPGGVGFIRPFFYDEVPGLDSTPCHRSTSVRNRMIYPQALRGILAHFVDELTPDLAVVPEGAALDVPRRQGLDSLDARTSVHPLRSR